MPGLLTRITSFIPSRVKRVAEAYRTSSTRVFQSGPTDDSSGMTPWGFFISYYGLVLLAVALITNRIWAVVRPAGPMDRRQAEQDDPSIEQPRWKIILRRTLTSTQTHRLLRIPSLLYVLYSVYLLTLCLLPHPTSPTASPWMASLPLANQTLTMPTEKLFKRVFTSIAVGLITGTFARSLEGFAHVGSQANLFSSPGCTGLNAPKGGPEIGCCRLQYADRSKS
ncbi:hypothetical protein [Phaffia rhodozyma]|uniref:Uncharacterized protein n=1 Tax=Phaffia rhodozyma TaxID=264483 RepID=A0A0F7SNA8_PHARH|nr:hypothetical protein [Phaffia rhodozyma]